MAQFFPQTFLILVIERIQWADHVALFSKNFPILAQWPVLPGRLTGALQFHLAALSGPNPREEARCRVLQLPLQSADGSVLFRLPGQRTRRPSAPLYALLLPLGRARRARNLLGQPRSRFRVGAPEWAADRPCMRGPPSLRFAVRWTGVDATIPSRPLQGERFA